MCPRCPRRASARSRRRCHAGGTASRTARGYSPPPRAPPSARGLAAAGSPRSPRPPREETLGVPRTSWASLGSWSRAPLDEHVAPHEGDQGLDHVALLIAAQLLPLGDEVVLGAPPRRVAAPSSSAEHLAGHAGPYR